MNILVWFEINIFHRMKPKWMCWIGRRLCQFNTYQACRRCRTSYTFSKVYVDSLLAKERTEREQIRLKYIK